MKDSEDPARIIFSSTSRPASLVYQPILTPTPPSTQHGMTGSRSPGLIRKAMGLLERATPSIRFCLPEKAVIQPFEVVTLRRFLVRDLGIRVIPSAFEAYLQAADPFGFEDIPRTMFDECQPGVTQELENRWKQIEYTYSEAVRCQNYHKDENARTEVVRLVFQQCTAVPFAKKVDTALAFKPYHERVRKSLKDVQDKRPGMSLSQMSDAYTSGVVLPCGIEIRGSSGSYDEAIVQLGIWYSAGLQKRQEMSVTNASPSQKPLLGWTVIGHEWRPHISWRDDITGDVVGYP
ncbi:uncharacterized protein Z518_07862 [Rhinocladiella mackenziei CBS 650.93]|uniref:Rhinocladiella mackenziei CBS 650.93 unplaced genomic scaffold supercont1.6, whole genome shotgun sequence n=1 Tax=Rhinocladiella mackenziei CBS 650.93 TaxID=1442369 RepID=A0A0D2GUD9_9EURO|nr:uncharacterized protein Z518_07862 [Rhinocladiella mackenziei CBS 650.93]KIX01923.1 hypothetical protein Z518_07862 [Rhinocladiella mackenziei CBS 650.93]